MTKLTDRRKSPLAAVHPAAPATVAAAVAEQAVTSPAAPPAKPSAVKSTPPAAPAARGRGPQRTNPSRRLGKPAPLDMVSFNCNLTRDARAKAKMYAASIDVALQDVVEAALIAYLEPRGFDVERRPDAPELP